MMIVIHRANIILNWASAIPYKQIGDMKFPWKNNTHLAMRNLAYQKGLCPLLRKQPHDLNPKYHASIQLWLILIWMGM